MNVAKFNRRLREHLKFLLLERNITHKELAEAIGVKPYVLAGVFYRQQGLSLYNAIRICNALKLSLDELVDINTKDINKILKFYEEKDTETITLPTGAKPINGNCIEGIII